MRVPSEDDRDLPQRKTSTVSNIGFDRQMSPLIPLDGAPQTRSAQRCSLLETHRAEELPEFPDILAGGGPLRLKQAEGEDQPSAVLDEVQEILGPMMAGLCTQVVVPDDGPGEPAGQKPLHVGVVSLSGGVAAVSAGTHNAILGLQAFMEERSPPGSRLWGIRHLTKGHEFPIIGEEVAHYLNQSGSDLLPPVILQKATDRVMKQVAGLCEKMDLDGLVFLCSPTEVSEVAKIAAHFHKNSVKTAVSVIIQSLNGWVQVKDWMPTNLGFDSACSSLAEVSGNIALSREALDKDFYHFVAVGSPRLTLEVALQVRPTLSFLGVDVNNQGLTLQGIIDLICDVVVDRHHKYGLHSGVVLVSDDFFEELVEMKVLRKEIHRLRMEKTFEMRSKEGAMKLLEKEKPDLAAFFSLLNEDVRTCLVLRAGIDGLPMLKQVEVERELGGLVSRNLARRGAEGKPFVQSFSPQPLSLRPLSLCPFPTVLDCALGYALGQVAAFLCTRGVSGYAASVSNPISPTKEWKPCGVPLARLLEVSPTDKTLVVRRKVLGPEDPLIILWRRVRKAWRYTMSYRQPGPVQYWGPSRERPETWASYHLRIAFTTVDALVEELQVDSGPAETFQVPWRRPFWLVRRNMALLSPLQRWRCEYQPVLPKVFSGRLRVVEEDRKGRVCADLRKLYAHFPNLVRLDALKAVKIESITGIQSRWASKTSVTSLQPEQMDPVEEHGPIYKMPSPRHPASSRRRAWDSPPSWDPIELEEEFEVEMTMKEDPKEPKQRIGFAIIGKAGPGVNNVLKGLADYMEGIGGVVFGIAMGICGLANGYAFEIKKEMLTPHLNQGGCDLLGQSLPEDLKHLGEDFGKIVATARKLELDGLVIWGGRKVHAWTLRLAEHFAEHQAQTSVIAVPASTQSDLPLIEQTIGYDTICKLFSSIVGNLATQAASSGRLWYFTRIPGRSISHIAAEVALETQPHVVLMFEDVHESQHLSLSEVTQMICNVVEARANRGMNFGVVLIPDQFLASVHQMRLLFEEVEQIWRSCPEALEQSVTRDFGSVLSLLPPLSRALFQSLPERTRGGICGMILEAVRHSYTQEELDSGGRGTERKLEMDLCKVETEVILQTLVETELTRRVVLGTYKGPFQAMTYAMPYHGRAAMPTNFDCDLGYTIGYAAGVFADTKCTGLLVDVRLLKEKNDLWEVGGTPLSSLVTFREDNVSRGKDGIRRFAKGKEVANPFEIQPRHRLLYDLGYEKNMPDPCDRTLVCPGPVQYEGPCSNTKTQTLCMPQLQRIRQMARTEKLITELRAKARAGCPPEVLQAVKMLLQGGVDLLKQM